MGDVVLSVSSVDPESMSQLGSASRQTPLPERVDRLQEART